MMRALLAITLAASAYAHADEGEIQVGASASLEAASLRYPLAPVAPVLVDANLISPLPRLALRGRYDFTNEVATGAALELASTANATTRGVPFGNVTSAVLITGTYFELATPLSISWRADIGDMTASVALETGPLLSLWSGNVLADPSRPDDAGRPAKLPVELRDAPQVGVLGRVNVYVDLRLFEHLALRIGPSVSLIWSGSPSIRAGVTCALDWATAIGPH